MIYINKQLIKRKICRKSFILRVKEIKEKFKRDLVSCIIQEISNVKWENIVGLEKAKEALKEVVIFPVKFTKLF